MADLLLAQIAPKNNCNVFGENLETEYNMENTVAFGKGTDRIFGSGSANKKSFYMPFRPMSMR